MERDSFGHAISRVAAHHLTRRAALRGGVGLAATFGLTRLHALAQEGTPAPSGPVTLAAHRLTNPRGFDWNSKGELYVALAGSSGASVLGSEEDGYATTGYSGILARIDNGEPVTASDYFPSTTVSGERTLGPASVAFLGDEPYVLLDANAMAFRLNTRHPDGVYRVVGDGSFFLVADTAAWITANPTRFKPADYNPEGELMGMVAIGDILWVVESNNGQVLTISLNGTIERMADLSDNHPLPTSPARSPNGGVYVGFLTPAPYTDGSSKVVEVTPDATVKDVWTGLTMVTAVATAPDGTLYAAEMATGNTNERPYVAPETGRIVRQTGPDTLEEVVTNVNYPVALAFGPDGALYVACPAMGTIDPDGYILRIDVSAKGPTDVRPVAATAGGRDYSPQSTDYFGGTPEATAAAADTTTATETPAAETPAAETPAAETPAAAASTETAPAASGNTVSMEAGNFYFKPNAVTIAANTAVTFEIKNVAQIPHNFTIDELKISEALPPGETTNVTVNAPAGSYQFYCNLPGHRAAGMFGTLTVS